MSTILTVYPHENVLLDVGCGSGLQLHYFKWNVTRAITAIGVDRFLPELEKIKRLLDHVVCADAAWLPFKPDSVDVAFYTDVCEHQTREEAQRTLRYLKQIAKRIQITTPNGFVRMDSRRFYRNQLQTHISAWTTQDLQQLGFRHIRGYNWRVRLPRILQRFLPWLPFYFTSLAECLWGEWKR